MKTKITLLLLLIPILSPFAQSNLVEPKRIEINRSAEIQKVRRDSVFIDLKTLAKTDTLKLFTTIMDCGEFGGNNELIKIFVRKNTLYAQHESQPLCDNIDDACKGNTNGEVNYKLSHKTKYKVNKALKLNEVTTELVQNYIVSFNNFLRSGDVESNASNDFWISLNGKVLATRHDKLGKWEAFILLRDKLYIGVI